MNHTTKTIFLGSTILASFATGLADITPLTKIGFMSCIILSALVCYDLLTTKTKKKQKTRTKKLNTGGQNV